MREHVRFHQRRNDWLRQLFRSEMRSHMTGFFHMIESLNNACKMCVILSHSFL